MEYYKEKGSSNTQIIKKFAKSILKDRKGEPVYLREIRRIIMAELGGEFSAGVYSSAMRDLIEEEKGRVVNVDRGVYMYVKSPKKHEINEILDKCVISLKDAAYVNLLEVEEDDIRYIKHINEMIESVENLKFK